MRPTDSSVVPKQSCSPVMTRLMLAALLALCVGSAEAADRHVSTTGSDASNNCTNPASPCRTIQRAIGQVAADEMIKVQTGTYVENIVITRDLVGVSIEGGWGEGGTGYTNDPSATVISGAGVYPSSTIKIDLDDEELDLTIRNFKVVGGNADYGGGLYVRTPDSGAAWLRIYSVEFVENQARYYGGAIYLYSVDSRFFDAFQLIATNSVFTSNDCWEGGGGAIAAINYSYRLNLDLYDNTFSSNHSLYEGGAFRVDAYDSGSVVDPDTAYVKMLRNVLDGNTADASGGGGGGLVLRTSQKGRIQADLHNNLIVNNNTGILALSYDYGTVSLDMNGDTVAHNGGLGGVYADSMTTGTGFIDVDVSNAILWGNTGRDLRIDYYSAGSAEYSDIGIVTTESHDSTYTDDGGNISVDPLFVDAAGGDYHLQWDSPAVDASSCAGVSYGDDREHDPRPDPVTGLCDMGCDEVVTAVVNNGLTDNVIDDDRYAGNSGLDVYNRFCPGGGSCPGDPTRVEVLDGAVMGRWIRTFQTSVVTLRGGATQGGALYASDASLIEIVGSRFEVDDVRVPMGDLTATTGTLTGRLESGESIELVFYQGGYGGEYDGAVRLLAPSDAHFVNNGLAPPNPDNVINNNDYDENFVAVRNAGCTGVLDCAAPGAATQLNLTGGKTQELQVFDSSSLDMTGGYVYGSLLANDSASLVLRGGSSAWDLAAFDEASVVLGQAGESCGVGGDVFAFGSSEVAITWGYAGGDLRAFDASTIAVKRGSTYRKDLYAADASTIELHGYDFRLDGFAVGYGDLGPTSGQIDGELVVSGDSRFNFQRTGGGTIRLLEGATTYVNFGGYISISIDTLEFHRVYVRNQGCAGEPASACGSSVPTGLRLSEGALVGSRLYFSDDSWLDMSGGIVGGALHAYHNAQIDITGGSVKIKGGVRTYNASIFNMSNGWIYRLSAFGSSTATLSGGAVSYGAYVDQSATLFLNGAVISSNGVDVLGSGTMTMSAGSITGDLEFQSSSSLLLEGGSVFGSLLARSGTVTMTGGSVGNLEVSSFGMPVSVSVSGGEIWQSLVVNGSSEASVTGGIIGAIQANEFSTIVVDAGDVSSLFALDDSTLEVNDVAMSDGNLNASGSSGVTVNGGELGGVVATGTSMVEVHGGTIGGAGVGGIELAAQGSSTIQVFGYGFTVDGGSVEPGELAATTGTLTGTLESLEPLSVDFRHGEVSGMFTGTIELVPEPALALMQGLALLSLAALRRWRRTL